MAAAGLDTLDADLAGSRAALLALTLKTTLLSVATLGLYSFWARTRVRRWLWSALRVGGTPFEYLGKPLEKLMGFVIAAAIVATYLGVVVMLLVFAAITLFQTPGPGIAAAFAMVLPVYWFAQYRGLRYLLNHTRWRGLSFGMEPCAWGYTWRAILWTALTVVTLGAALPWRTHALWRFRAARTRYGDAAFRLEGEARPLVRLWLPIWATGWAVAATAAIWGAQASGGWQDPEANARALGLITLICAPILVLLWVRWRVRAFAMLAGAMRYGEGAALSVAPRVGRVIRIHLLGWIVVGTLLVAILLGLGIALGVLAVGGLEALPRSGDLATVSPYVVAVIGLLAYLTLFLLRGALRTAFVTYPLIRHVGETLVVSNATEVVSTKAGRSRHMADADGFANLFDMGAGI
ncbi:DUF898 family protein [Jannaschia ovalis]|uniref:DUF898 family protein n=1 Tax=Jannaschia ovalis TaxID=3038773 RepID=A0ABY8LDG4_9RHOB|nr:DUF898 family protein [Jannaschia sp. GRR-S6-38]WGH79186.1 DUF898 family protein [Jannaschia sp. GRR-S6-38]